MLLLVENKLSFKGKFHSGTDKECASMGNYVTSDARWFMRVTPLSVFMNLTLNDIDNVQRRKAVFSPSIV